MNGTTYKIRKGFLIPMGLTVILGLVLLGLGILLKMPAGRLYLLAAFMLPAVLILVESSRRRIHLAPDHILAEKVLRSKRIAYSDLTSVDAVRVRKRVFVSLTTADSFLIISNSYERFDDLVRRLTDLVPQHTISEEARAMAADPPMKCGDIFSAWLAVAVLVLVILAQLRTAF